MKKVFNLKFFPIIFIIAIASFLRIYRIADYMTFLGDEGRDVLVVYGILHGHFTLLGPTASVGGFFLGPIYYYFMAPFLWLFNYDPVGPAIMVALFGVATVWLVYKIGSEFFNQKVGLIAAFLYSISPLVIAYSRSSWNPNLMPFFSLLTLYILYKALRKNSIIAFLICGFLLGITMQLHYLALFLTVIMLVYIALIRRSFSKTIKDYFLVFAGFIVGWSPFLAFEARHGFPNIKSILSFIFISKDTGANNHFFQTIYDVFFRLFGRLITSFPPPEQVALGAHKNIALWYYATLLLGITSVVAVFKSKSSPKRTLILTWLILGVLLFGFYKKPIYDYYFGFMFPLPFLLVGNTLFFLFKQQKILKIIAIVSLLLIFWVNIIGVPFRFPANRQLTQAKGISSFVFSKTDNKPFNFALITGGNSDHAYRYFFTLWGKPPIAIENEIIDSQRKTVTDQLLVVCEVTCHPLGDPLWEVAGFSRAEIVGHWNVSVVTVYKLGHYKGK